MTSPISIKGVKDGLLVNVPPIPWDEALATLLASMNDQEDFFRGARIALELHDLDLGAVELGHLRDELAERGIGLWAVLSSSDLTRTSAADMGFALSIQGETEQGYEDDEYNLPELKGEEAMLLQRTLRSGQCIRFPGHVIVMGDVNPGAEIIAAGHIIIWGRVRGTLHAGASGDDTARICALDLSPTQLRIAGHVATSPSRKGKPKPEIVRMRDGQLVAEPWSEKRR